MGCILAELVPGLSRRFPVMHLDFEQPRGQVYILNETLKGPPRALYLARVGWNLAVWVPGHSRRFTVTHLNFWQPVVRIHVISKTLKWLFGKFEGLIRNIGSGCLFLVSLKLLQASAYHLVLRTFAKLSQEVPSWHCPRFRIFYRTNFCQTATTQIKLEYLNPFGLTNPK